MISFLMAWVADCRAWVFLLSSAEKVLVSAETQPSSWQEQIFSRPRRKVSSKLRAGDTFIDI
jgi:hypothetical protein